MSPGKGEQNRGPVGQVVFKIFVDFRRAWPASSAHGARAMLTSLLYRDQKLGLDAQTVVGRGETDVPVYLVSWIASG